MMGAAWLIAAWFVVQPGAAADLPEIVFERASRSVVTVHSIDDAGRILARGSGVVMIKDVLVTNCHVVARGKQFLVGHSKRRLSARLVAYDAERDLCALDVQGLGAAPARVGDGKGLKVGQRVYAIGTPEGFELTLSDGLISGLRESDMGRYLQITAPISEGSSGGGLFDSAGRLIGIVSFSYSPGQNLNFAVPADRVVELAKKAAVAQGESSAGQLELPAKMTQQWRAPFLKQQ